jgi:enoyl-[acyl-carrier protein] reductase I
MPLTRPILDLSGKRGLVVGIANEHSIAAGCARPLPPAGRGWRHLSERQGPPFVEPVAKAAGAEWLAPATCASRAS